MDLFELVNDHALPSVHALLIEPFKSMWEEDESDRKTDCIKKFTYIELLCSPKKSNPYFGLSEQEREITLKRAIFQGQTPSNVEQIILAIHKYKDLLEEASPTYDLLLAAYSAKEKLVEFLKDLDPAAKTKSDTLILKPKDITAALKDVFETAKSLDAARNKMNQELMEESRTRKSRTPGRYER
jgi:hypothetical protein